MNSTPDIWIPGKSSEKLQDYNTIDPTDSDAERFAKVEIFVAKRLGTRLTQLYPNRQWGVKVDLNGGVVVILCPSVSNTKGYVISLQRSVTEIEGMLGRVGGEILERAGLTTATKFNPDTLETLKRTARDEVITSDLEAPEEKYARSIKTRRQ